MVLFDVKYTLSREDIADSLSRAPLRRASKGRLIGQSIALAFVFVWCAVAFAMDDAHEPMSLVIALAAAALMAAMWVVPQMETRRAIDEAAENARPVHLWVLENGVDFGDDTPEKAYYEFGQLQWFLPDEQTRDTIVWRLPSYDVIVVPKEALTEEQWTLLMEKAM